jgi:MFS family permease
LLAVSVACLILAINLGGNIYPWNHPTIISSLMLSVVTSLRLVSVERKAELSVMPLTILSSAPRANLVFSNFAAYMGYSTIVFNVPLFFQAVSLETASAPGLCQSVPNVAVTVFGVLSGYYMTWTGRMKALILGGSFFMVLGSIFLTPMWYGIPTWLAAFFLIPASLGMGLNTPAVSVAVLATSKYEEQVVVTITLIVWRRLGAVTGIAISSLILQNTLSSRLDHLVTGSHKDEVCQFLFIPAGFFPN